LAGKKSSGLNKIGAALMALGEGRSDIPSSAAPLPLYHPEAHVHQTRRTKAHVSSDLSQEPPAQHRRAS
jgi:hypothetical protein